MGVISPGVVQEVLTRAEGRCEACGAPAWGDMALHHRKPRRYGDHCAANLMYVHGGITGGCHNLHQGSIHQNPARSKRLGHILLEREDPATRPVVTVANLRLLRA